MLQPEESLAAQLERAHRRAERERTARREAEALLEAKSLELFRSNEQLRQQASELESVVAERTAALREALTKAEAATRAKSEFLAAVSHEIRTPLNGIIGLADVLSLSKLDDEQSRHLGLLLESGQSLLTLINDLLDFSKIEAGRLDLEERVFDPTAELRGIIATFRPQALAKSLELTDDLGELPETVLGDSLRLRQILSNLLSNALKFTSEGRISVAAGAAREGADWRIKFSVTDTGIGFQPGAEERLFEPFRQEDTSISRKFGGTGLGLAICRRLARAMGGEVRASCDGVTTFRVEVLLRSAEDARRERTSDAACSLPNLSVLVVDDNKINRTVATTLLRKLGQKALEADSGPAALELVARKHFDLILMDMQMPGMDGLATTREIRGQSLEKQPRIVALTANAFGSDRERCRAAGMDGFLPKPFRLEDLRAELCAVCRAQGAATCQGD